MQSTYLDNSQFQSTQQEELFDDGIEDFGKPETAQKLETLKIFKESWLYAEIMSSLREKYQALFDEAVTETNRDIRSDKLEQMKGVAFATGIFDMLENELKQQLGE